MVETPPTRAFEVDRLAAKSLADPFLAIAIGNEVHRLAWGPFWDQVAGHAAAIERDTRPVDFILIMARTRLDAIACFLAAIAAGRLVSFFPPPHRVQDRDSYRRQQAAAIAKIGPDHILTFDSETAATVRELGFSGVLRPLKLPPSGDGRGALSAFLTRLVGDERPLFVQHSSGTTGIKKAVAVTPSMLAAQFASYWVGVVEALAPKPKIASWLPLYHDMGLVATLLLPTMGGAEVTYIDPFVWVEAPQSLLDTIERERSNLVWMPNFAFRHYARLRRGLRSRDLSSVRAWINCSEPCRAPDADAFEARFADMGTPSGSVVGCYAMAETVFAISQGQVGRRAIIHAGADQVVGEAVRSGDKAVLSSGRPIAGIEVAVFSGREIVPEGHYGEIGVRGDFVFGGYGRLTAAESNIGEDGYFLTGDLGAMREGELFIFGRSKEMIIVNGKNIFAGDVEALVGDAEGLKRGRVVAFGLDNPLTGSEDLIIVAERDGSDRDLGEIVSQVTRLIDATFLISPKAVMVVEERWLAKTTSGKVSRSENMLKYLRIRDADIVAT